MTERDDNVVQDAAADSAYRSFYKSKEWLRQEARDNRSDDAVFSVKSADEVMHLDALRDAISRFFDVHLPSFEQISRNIKKFEEGLHVLPGGKEEAVRLCDPALFALLTAVQERLLPILENPRGYKRDVEIQRQDSGQSFGGQLRILSQRSRAAIQQTISKIGESLGKFVTDASPRQSRPDWFYTELESIYQGHRAEKKSVIDAVRRHCPSHIADILDALNGFMASEAKAAIFGNTERLRELLIVPLSGLVTDLEALDLAMERLENLDTTAKCIRAGGEDARLAAVNLVTEQLRIARESMKPGIESH